MRGFVEPAGTALKDGRACLAYSTAGKCARAAPCLCALRTVNAFRRLGRGIRRQKQAGRNVVVFAPVLVDGHKNAGQATVRNGPRFLGLLASRARSLYTASSTPLRLQLSSFNCPTFSLDLQLGYGRIGNRPPQPWQRTSNVFPQYKVYHGLSWIATAPRSPGAITTLPDQTYGRA